MSRLLLDSHILLWYADGDPRLTPGIVEQIRRANLVVFSAASVWELSLKMFVGKLPHRDLRSLAHLAGCDLLDVSAQHAESIAFLPRIHKDPFDHLLLAQAKLEDLTLVTHDRILADYGVPVLLV